jgi:hypothetical protein
MGHYSNLGRDLGYILSDYCTEHKIGSEFNVLCSWTRKKACRARVQISLPTAGMKLNIFGATIPVIFSPVR